MGIEKLLTRSRAERLNDPEIQQGIDDEWERVKQSFVRLGDQTRDTCAGIVYNSLVRPFVQFEEKGKKEFAPAKQMIHGAADSTGKTLALIGRILLATGRATKYGIRRGLAI